MSSQPSYEDLTALVTVQARVIDELRAEVAELKRRLGMDSSNSSKPPSSDPPEKKGVRSQRVRSRDRRPGGQSGHAGRSLERVAVPDRVVVLEPECCGQCGGGLGASEGVRTVQVVDVPLPAPKVTEYRMKRRRCVSCKAVTVADAPAGVSGPVCYGPNLRALTTFLAVEGQISTERTAKLVAAILSQPVSTGFVDRCLARLDGELDHFEGTLKQRLAGAPVLHTDETPISLAGKRAYSYTARTADLVWYGVHASRGHAALDGFGILPAFRGVLIRDDYIGYAKYDGKLSGVQLCCAHLIRDLQGVIDNAAGPDTSAWAEQAQCVLREAHQAVQTAVRAGRDTLDPKVLASLEQAFRHAVNCGISVNPVPLGAKKPKARVLAERLKAKTDQVLLFTRRFADGVVWTNNAAEQALRDVKVKLRVSGCWRSAAGAARFARIRSYLATTRAHDIQPLSAIRAALTGNPWMPSPSTP